MFEQPDRPVFINPSASPSIRFTTPTGDPKYHLLVMDVCNKYIAFTSAGRRIALPLFEENRLLFAEYDNKRHLVCQYIGGAVTLFFQNAIALFLRMAKDIDAGEAYLQTKTQAIGGDLQ